MGNGNLVMNGTFSGSLSGAYKNCMPGGGAPTPEGWGPVSPGGYDWLASSVAKHKRNLQAVDLGAEFRGDGGVMQTIETMPNMRYELSFDHSSNPYPTCGGGVMNFTVKILDDESGEEIESRNFDPGAAPAQPAPNWKRGKFIFIAGGDRTIIEFRGNGKTSCQAALTDVRVFVVSDGGIFVR